MWPHLKAEVLKQARIARQQCCRQRLCRGLSDRVAGCSLEDGLPNALADCLLCIQTLLLACMNNIQDLLIAFDPTFVVSHMVSHILYLKVASSDHTACFLDVPGR